ncbi:unnamed protein product [Protopolystoma xenopodis]|uniref:Uncharacterized protein n=1 Tax=Protopolystoma xenopodis TaxID=117903 RepID=A0A448XAI3_9PLAT|nr:unnamed protein product [Protopolystoma xenopodis]
MNDGRLVDTGTDNTVIFRTGFRQDEGRGSLENIPGLFSNGTTMGPLRKLTF